MRDRSSPLSASSERPGAAACQPAAATRPRLRSVRDLMATARDWWRGEDKCLRALAGIDADRVSDLSETGRLLRRAARRRFRLHP